MGERVLYYNQQGKGCAASILLAARDYYGIAVDEKLEQAGKAVCPGFGVGSFCSAFVACIMVMGLVLPETEVPQARLQFLMQMQEKWGSLNCGIISAQASDCNEVLVSAAEALEAVLADRCEC